MNLKNLPYLLFILFRFPALVELWGGYQGKEESYSILVKESSVGRETGQVLSNVGLLFSVPKERNKPESFKLFILQIQPVVL